mmetsp:Transcript_5157/g.9651  ORF Transcript_5157/g.9651 Transcript_5157/m.9651 type:complete len:150 (+) Transcript_5157:936-1385(+)
MHEIGPDPQNANGTYSNNAGNARCNDGSFLVFLLSTHSINARTARTHKLFCLRSSQSAKHQDQHYRSTQQQNSDTKLSQRSKKSEENQCCSFTEEVAKAGARACVCRNPVCGQERFVVEMLEENVSKAEKTRKGSREDENRDEEKQWRQ